jgi:hypothetical protein
LFFFFFFFHFCLRVARDKKRHDPSFPAVSRLVACQAGDIRVMLPAVLEGPHFQVTDKKFSVESRAAIQ